MKILISVTYYYPYVSGLTIYTQRLAEWLVSQEHEVTVLCMKNDNKLESQEKINGVKVIRAKTIKKINKGFLSYDFVVKAAVESGKADLVINNLPQVEGIWTMAWAWLFLKRRWVIYHCEINTENKLLQTGVELCNWVSLALANKIITYTEDYAKHSLLLKDFYKKTEFVYPPVPVPDTEIELKRSLHKKIGTGYFVVGVAARLAKEKGLEYLFEAIPLLKNKIRIAVAGPIEPVGEEDYKNRILNVVKNYDENIIILDTVNPKNMGSFYELIDVLVLPSIDSTEAFGMVQVEAMKKGVPVIATDLPGVRVPILETGMGILVKPKSSEELALAIEEIREHTEKYKTGQIEKFDVSNTWRWYESRLVA